MLEQKGLSRGCGTEQHGNRVWLESLYSVSGSVLVQIFVWLALTCAAASVCAVILAGATPGVYPDVRCGRFS